MGLIEVLKQHKKYTDKVMLGQAIVKSINGNLCDLEVENDAIIYDAQLIATEDAANNSLQVTPVVGSVVVYALLGKKEESAVVISFSEIEKVATKIGNTEFEISAAGFKIKRASANAKDIFKNIIESQQQIMVIYGNNPDYAKLTTALTDLNNLFL